MLNIKEKMGIAKRYTRYFDTEIYVDFMGDKPSQMPRLVFAESKESFTDHRQIQIGLDMIPAETEEELIWKISYILGHELQHIHSTTQRDWEAGLSMGTNEIFTRAYQKAFGKSSKTLARVGSIEKLAKALETTDTRLSMNHVQSFVHYIMNALEDGRIEQIRSFNDQQFAKEMKAFRAETYENSNLDDFLGQDMELPANPSDLNAIQTLTIILNQILTLATSQVYQKGFLRNYGNSCLVKKVSGLKTSIKSGISAKTCRECMTHAVHIVTLLSDDIIEASKESDFERFMRQMMEAIKSTEKMKPSATAHDEQKGSGQMSSVFDNLSDLDENNVNNSDNSDGGNDTSQDGNCSSASDAQNAEDKAQDTYNSAKTEADNAKDTLDSAKAAKESAASQVTDAQKAADDANAHDVVVSKAAEKAKADAKKTTDTVANDAKLAAVTEEQFKKRMKDYKGTPLQKIDLSQIEKIYVEDQYSHFEENERSYQPDLLPPFSLQNKGSALKRKIKNIFKARKQPDQRAMRSGRVDSSRLTSLIFSDPAIFTRKGEERDPEAAIYILQDNSGSMGDYAGSKRYMCCDAISIVEMALADFFPLKIAAFDIKRDTVRHICVKGFDEKGPNFSYNFREKAKSGYGNKDGFSIRVAAQELMTRPEQDRILIVASDGLPSDYSGGIQSGIVDTHNAISEARAKGITVIGMFLTDEWTQDDEVEHFKYMYDNKFAFIVNMDTFADKLSEVLRKAIENVF